MRICIKNGILLDGGNEEKADLYLKDGIIEGLNLDLSSDKIDETYDAQGNIVTPALIDLHAHLREPGQEAKEDLCTGLSAAAAGGYGTVISMANTSPPVDDPSVVASLIAKAEAIGQARLRPAATLSKGLKGLELTDFAALKDAGAVMITDDGIPVTDSHLMRRACEYAAELGLVIQTHSEEPSLRKDGIMNEGVVSQRLGLQGNPVEAESIMIFRDCELALMTGARVHIAHITTERGMKVVEWFKEQGAPVTGEVTPNHLTLTDEVMSNFDPICKVAPPLRTEADRLYLRDAVKRGVVDNIGTDHAPHTRAEKDQDMLNAPFGIANIEVSFPLCYTSLVANNEMSLSNLLELYQGKAAAVMGWEAPSLAVGQPADIVVLDINTEKAVDASQFKSKAKFSPWEGLGLKGWPVATFVRGQKVFS